MEYDLKNINAKANGGLATGITALGIEALGLLGGGLGGILGGGNMMCHENMPVSRYELALEQKNAAKDAEIALLKANTYNDSKALELYKYFDGEIKALRNELCAQAVVNERTANSFLLVEKDLKRERDERCCADNSIITYANATFYPKLIADVTAGTTTTAQTLYNPLPNCGCCK